MAHKKMACKEMACKEMAKSVFRCRVCISPKLAVVVPVTGTQELGRRQE